MKAKKAKRVRFSIRPNGKPTYTKLTLNFYRSPGKYSQQMGYAIFGANYKRVSEMMSKIYPWIK